MSRASKRPCCELAARKGWPAPAVTGERFPSFRGVDRFIEPNLIAERINNTGFDRAPLGGVEAGVHVAVPLLGKLRLESADPSHENPQSRPGRAVAMVLAELQRQSTAGNLAIKRGVVVEAMVPVHREPKEAEVEFIGLEDVEYSQDRHDCEEFNR